MRRGAQWRPVALRNHSSFLRIPCLGVCVHVCVCVDVCMCVYLRMGVCVCLHLSVCVSVCICLCVCVSTQLGSRCRPQGKPGRREACTPGFARATVSASPGREKEHSTRVLPLKLLSNQPNRTASEGSLPLESTRRENETARCVCVCAGVCVCVCARVLPLKL